MKIRLPAHAMLNDKGYIILKETCKADRELIKRIFNKKIEWEIRNGREYFFNVTLALEYQHRTFKQNSAVWVLVTAIFDAMEGRLPDEEEKYDMYLDLLEVYADRVPNRLNGGTRPIHISESNSVEGAKFIDGLLYHLATECNLSYKTQTTVQEVLQEWEEWRGGLETDYSDYSDREQTKMLTEEEWRQKHVYSEASGRGGAIARAHIVTRGADAADIEASWNWIALTPEEHAEQHRVGWDEFLAIYPHLRGRVNRARKLAGKKELKELPAQTMLENMVNEALA